MGHRLKFLLDIPEKRDWKLVIGLMGLLLLAILLPQSGRIGGASLLGKAKAVGTIAAVFLPPVIIGFRQKSPLVAFVIAYLFILVVYIATGMWRLTTSGGPNTTAGLIFSTLVFNLLRASIVGFGGYVLGLVVSLIEKYLQNHYNSTV